MDITGMAGKAHDAWGRFRRKEQERALRFGPKPERPLDTKRKLPKMEIPSVSVTTPDEIEAYVAAFRPVFRYRPTMEQAQLYLLGLLSDLKRKNGETMEAGIPGATQQGVWDFLVRSPWSACILDASAVQHFLAATGTAGQPIDVVVDEVSELKQGRDTVGAIRQYLGCVGKTANGQVSVTLHGLIEEYDLPLCGQLYLPKEWVEDDKRRMRARVPEELRFQTKLELALRLLKSVAGWGLTIGRVYGDPGYGELKLMLQLDEKGWAYCFGVRRTFTVRLPEEPLPPQPTTPAYSGRGRSRKAPVVRPQLHTASEVRDGLPAHLWQRVPYRHGTDGTTLMREFAAIRAWPATAEQEGKPLWLLFERPLDPSSKDIKQYAISGPETLTLDELARLAHRRPIIERNAYENGKQEVGLGDYQGRSWPGFHHHLAMVWLALTWLQLHRRRLTPDHPDPEPAPSIPEPAQPTSGPTAPSAAPPAPPQVPLQFAASVVPALVAPRATVPLALPRQAWESAQAVRRRLCAWFRAVTHLELLLAGASPHIPSLTPGSGP